MWGRKEEAAQVPKTARTRGKREGRGFDDSQVFFGVSFTKTGSTGGEATCLEEKTSLFSDTEMMCLSDTHREEECESGSGSRRRNLS